MSAPPSDWPILRVVDHGADGTIANCSRATNLFTWPPLGCALIFFKERVCHVWAMTEWVYAEEVKHCEGRDHAGGASLAEAWEKYKRAGGR